MASLFVTGTDTGVGKTTITCAIARAVRSRGQTVSVLKPVATGADWHGDQLLSEDTVRLAEAVGKDPLTSGITKWVFREPVAPPVAARQAGVVLELDAIRKEILSKQREHTLLLVEGVGGLMCPLTENETMADLVTALRIPVLVVTRRSLGTLNHTLLTLEVARTRGLDVRGIIVNEVEPPSGLADETNVMELRRRISVPILAIYPHDVGTRENPLVDIDWWTVSG